jgi:hypothetical protein
MVEIPHSNNQALLQSEYNNEILSRSISNVIVDGVAINVLDESPEIVLQRPFTIAVNEDTRIDSIMGQVVNFNNTQKPAAVNERIRVLVAFNPSKSVTDQAQFLSAS